MERSNAAQAGQQIAREGAGYRLRLWGPLPSDWAGNLALHAYVSGIEVVSGDALRTGEGSWAASLLVQSDARQDAAHHDFLTMARRAPRFVPELPAPAVAFAASRSRTRPGDVFVSVTGKDSIGLVAHVLGRLARHGLRPRRFTLRTLRGEVADWFWMERDPASTSPPEAVSSIAGYVAPMR